MRIGIDVRDLATGIVGVGRTICDLLSAIKQEESDHQFILYQYTSDDYCQKSHVYKRIVRIPPYAYGREQITFSARAVLDQLDIFHAPIHVPPAYVPAKTKIVYTVHDLHSELHPSLFPSQMNHYFVGRRERAIEHTDALIVHSEYVKSVVLERTGIPEDRIHCIPCGVNPKYLHVLSHDAKEGIREKYALPDRYILYVGSVEPWKRVPFLIESVREYRRKSGDDIGLVIIGRDGWRVDECQQVNACVEECGWLYRLGYVDQGDLPGIYQCSTFFSTASVWEGFGIIFLEAMASAVPIVAPNRAAIPEVVGDAGLVYDADSTESAVECFSAILSDEVQYKKCVGCGKERLAKFSENEYGKQVLKVYEQLA